MLNKELEFALNESFKDAREHDHQFMTVEHLLLSITTNIKSVSEVLKACGVDINTFKEEISSFLETTTPKIPPNKDVETQPTLGFQRVLQRAVFHVQSAGKKEVTGLNILIAIFSEQESQAVVFLKKHNLSRLEVINNISNKTERDDLKDELEEAFKKQYDENFDFKKLLRLKEGELEEIRNELKKLQNEKETEIEEQKTISLALARSVKVSQHLIDDLKSEIAKLTQEQTANSILRSIEFKHEHRQAGLSILAYFSEIVAQKYPGKKIAVSIEQSENVVRLCINTAEGDKEIIEKTLDTYGLVVMGCESPDKLLSAPIHIAQLEHKLDLAKTEIRSFERILKIQDDSMEQLKETMQALISINQKSQGSLDNALSKIGGNREIYAAIKLIERLEPKKKLMKEEVEEIENSVRFIYSENPGAIQELKNYFLNVSSSMAGSIVLETIKNLGFM